MSAEPFSVPAIKNYLMECGLEESYAADASLSYYQESHYGYQIIAPYLEVLRSRKDRVRILEVGAGSCFLSARLLSEGWQVVSLEPVSLGFDAVGHLRKYSQKILAENGLSLSIWDTTAENMMFSSRGLFDFIFSINVLEHVQNLRTAFHNMGSAMAPGATMLHSCPNYLVPYEPHFGKLLIPFSKRRPLTIKLSTPQRTDLWKSINFIHYFQVLRYAKENGLKLQFRSGMMARAFERLLMDPAFASRQPASLVYLARFMKMTGILFLLQRLPAALGTPMEFCCHKNMKS